MIDFGRGKRKVSPKILALTELTKVSPKNLALAELSDWWNMYGDLREMYGNC